ncbi:MAG: hypothetical protein JO189_15685 [Deltaproteobacteria bacterium]|nr:hypothetical protein [Deltaproteobacteria bacterium]
MKKRRGIVIALSLGLAAGYIFAAAPNYAAPTNGASVNELSSAATNEVLAQASEPGLEAQEQQLINQIESDLTRLKADEAAERAHQRPVNPQRKWIREALMHVHDAVLALHHTTNHYSGHKGSALRALQDAHNHLMACYQIDSR